MLAMTSIFFFLSPLGSIPFSLRGMIFDKKKSKKYLLLFTMSIAVLSMFLEPRITDDGARVLALVRYYREIDFKQLLEIDRLYREPITHILFFLVSRTTTPKLVFAIGAFFQYYIILYVVIDYANKINARVSTRAQAILLFLCYHSYFPSVGSFRFYTATAICLLSWYLLTIKNKVKTGICLCLISSMIHSSFYIQLFIMIFTMISWMYTNKTKLIKIILLSWTLFMGVILNFLNLFSDIYLFNLSAEKLVIYSNLEIDSYIQIILTISGLAMILLFLHMTYRRNKDLKIVAERKNAHKYYDLLSNYMFFCIGSIAIPPIFRRVIHLAVLSSVIPILMYGIQVNRNTITIFVQNAIIFMAILTGFIYSIQIVAAGFDVTIGGLFIRNLLWFIVDFLLKI